MRQKKKTDNRLKLRVKKSHDREQTVLKQSTKKNYCSLNLENLVFWFINEI